MSVRLTQTRLVFGTAGHIDHGKSSLVKALTGIDPDRLKEEKARGITIELGFAPLTLPGGERVAFVDVPGHERFIRTMVAGVTGIDAVLLVIAADEGVMPQTREHLDILRLLGVKRGLVVLTKIDQVDEELLALAQDDVEGFLKGSVLEGAPILPVSSVIGAGLPALLEALTSLAHHIPERSLDGPFRLPIDRVFSLRGFGTVVTGTACAGQVSPGDMLELVPGQLRVKVRGLQRHGEETERVFAGQRVALNLQGVEKERVERGMQLVSPGMMVTSALLDVSYLQLSSHDKPLHHRERVRFLSGTSEVVGVVHVLGIASDPLPGVQGVPEGLVGLEEAAWRALSAAPEPADGPGQGATSLQVLASGAERVGEVEPGQKAYLQLHLDEPVPARAGDRFVLRLESPLLTLGGGVVLDPESQKHRRHGRQDAAFWLSRLENGDDVEKLGIWLQLAGPDGIAVERLVRRGGLGLERTRRGLQARVTAGRAVWLDDEQRELVDADVFRRCQTLLLDRCAALHGASRLKPGLNRGELRGGLPYFGEKVFLRALEVLVRQEKLQLQGSLYRLPGFSPQLSATQEPHAARLRSLLSEAGTAPPLLNELKELTRLDEGPLLELLGFLTHTGEVVRVKEGHWMWAEALRGLQAQVVQHLMAVGELTPSSFKDLTGLTRKWAIPLLEYFDQTQVTLRVGEVRRLRGSEAGTRGTAS